MIGSLVDVVHSDGIDSQLFHLLGIDLTLLSLDQRVVLDELICNAYETGQSSTLEMLAAAWTDL
jgi:hypothetical protein